MSIIERATELLRPLEWSNAKPSGGPLERIEEAITEGKHAVLSEAGKLAAHLAADPGPAPEPRGTTRTVSIDRDQLRRRCMVAPDGARTPIAEDFRRIKRQILASMAQPKPGVPANLVLVTSALPGEGKTFCATNLAISIALEMDHSVLLVDADVAKPCIPDALGFKAELGLMDVLLDREMQLADVLCHTDIDKLTLLPAGTPHQRATELLASDAMRALLHEMAERYRDRIVIFDAPPLLVASEAGVLASRMGQIVLVVEAGRTSEAELKNALGRIEPGNVAALVLNKAESPGPAYNYAAR